MKTGWLILSAVCIPLIGLAQPVPQKMRPRVLMGDTSHCRAVWIQGGHLVAGDVCTLAQKQKPEVAWDGHVAIITGSDEKASDKWKAAHSLLSRLSIKHHDLYWDGKKVNLGKTDVYNLYEAIPWEGGVMIYGRTIPRRGFWKSWPFKGHFIEVRDLEPFCAIYFDPKTLKGEDLWINGKVYLGFFVFPLPD
ncbi:MAG TPA: hypothetical protein VLT16_11000 [Candidatus Limnocylindrales bacterium]|nr:hypothetical protein [Candidatus Limnocylindrales bacterium]